MMKDRRWIFPYLILFFSIFIPSTLFLFSSDHPKPVPYGVTFVSFNSEDGNQFHPTQVIPNDTGSCINDLYNRFQSGMLDLDSLREGLARCFSLNPNNGNNDSLIVPEPQPQQPTANTPRFV